VATYPESTMPTASTRVALPLALPLLLATACASMDADVGSSGGMGSADAGGDYGVTPGGSQDIGYVRELIDQGLIPSLDDWSAEGLFSEHDLPLDGETCDQLLCPRASAATLPLDGEMLVQVGFGTDLSADTWQRPPLNLAIAVDISGSMGDGKLSAVKTALRELSTHVDENDRVALIAFDDQASIRLRSTVMDDAGRVALRDAIADLHEDGATDISAGLRLAYSEVEPHADAAALEDRVMLFTDAMPNVGATNDDSFVGLVTRYAEEDIGLTVFGTGIDMGNELAEVMSEVRGGNYVYLPDPERIGTVFDEAFDFLVSPIAYDLFVELRTADGWRFVDAVGAPLEDPGAMLSFGAATLFLSNNDGGMAVMLEREPLSDGEAPPDGSTADGLADIGERLISFHVEYEDAETGELAGDDLTIGFDGGDAWVSEELGDTSPQADDLGVFKMAFLLDEIDALTAAGEFCAGNGQVEGVREAVLLAEERLAVAADTLDAAGEIGTGLDEESALMAALAANLEGGRGRCN